MNIVNLTIGRRLWLGFSLLMVLLVAMSTLGVNRLSELNQQMNEVIHNRYPKTVLASDINNQINVVARSIRNILLLKDPKQIRFEADRITAADKIVQERLATLDNVIDPENRGLLTTLLTTQKAYLEKRDEVLRMASEGARENATDVLITEVRPVQSAYMAAIEQLIARQRELMTESADAVDQDYQNASHLLIGLAAAGLLLAAAIAYAVTRSITVPLNRAVQVARTVASGDLTSQIDSSARDETGQLLEALKTMNDNLLTVVRQVRRGTDTIATATKEIASGNLDLSSRTEQQAGSLEETASAMEQLTSTVKQNADNVRQASQLAVSASEVAIQGGAVVGEVVNTMSSINESSKKIVDIISVIDGIAFQTNILALNAAVEAARAGEQGRGFAVVASEVRSLAQRSAAAAREIKILISDSVDKVDAGSKLVEQAGTTMHEVVTSVRRVTDIVGEISTAGQEQSAGIEQVNRAIVLIDETTQQNAALVEEAAAAAQSLQDQANRLVEVIDVFTLDEHIGQFHGNARAAIGHPGMSATPLALTSR